jgi:hypothetical protein
MVLGGNPARPWHDLFFTLGDLLSYGSWDFIWGYSQVGDTKGPMANPLLSENGLAWMAFERAKEEGSPRLALMTEYQATLPRPHVPYAQARAEAQEWVKAYQAREVEILKSGGDPHDDSLWTAFYAAHGTPERLHYPRVASAFERVPPQKKQFYFVVGGCVLAIILVLAIRVRRKLRSRKRLP